MKGSIVADDARCTPRELDEMLKRGDEFCLLDVRTEKELGYARIKGSEHIPLDELPGRIRELECWRDKPIVTMCHHGMRSETVQGYLVSHGFSRVMNLIGGIDAYAAEIDSTIGRY